VKPNEIESIDELLKSRAQATTSDAAAGGPLCGDPELLAAYVENSLDAEERESLRVHLASCAACREEVAALVRMAPREVVTDAPAHAAWWKQWIWAPALASLLVAGAWWMMSRQRVVQESDHIAKRDVSTEPRLPASSPALPPSPVAPRQEPKRALPRKTAPVNERIAAAAPVVTDMKEPKDVPQAAGGGGARPVTVQEARDGASRKQEAQSAPAAAPAPMQYQQGSLPPPPVVPSPVQNLPVQNSASQAQNAPLQAPSANDLVVVGGIPGAAVALPQNMPSEKNKSQAVGDQVNVVRTERPLSSAPVAGTAGAARALAKKMVAPAKGRIEKGAFQLSTDGGATWQSIVTPDAVVSFQITDASNIEIRTRTLAAFRTKDGGKTWQPKDPQQ
jgi:hypothetical protein